jgi:flagellar hook-associated protein 3 FlgL
MRITPGSMNNRLNADLQAALAALSKRENMLATNRRINAPSDDPGGTASAMNIRARQTANAQFQRNIDAVRSTLTAADSSARSVLDYIEQARDIAIQGTNDTTDSVSRQALGAQIDQILEAQVGLANGRAPNGMRLFGGQEATAAPYTVTRNVSGQITAVTVNPRGINGSVAAEVSEGLTVQESVSGDTVFGQLSAATNVFDTLIRVRDALNTNNGAAVGAELDNLQAAHDVATSASVSVGTRLGWLDQLDNRLKDESLVFSSSLSRVEDADMAQAATELRQIQNSYEGGIAAGARMLQLSLLDFLK